MLLTKSPCIVDLPALFKKKVVGEEPFLFASVHSVSKIIGFAGVLSIHVT